MHPRIAFEHSLPNTLRGVNGICRTSMGWNWLRNLRIQLFIMQGFMIILFIRQSSAFHVFARFVDKRKDLIQVPCGIFTVSCLLALYFSSVLNDNWVNFPRIVSKKAKTVIAVKMFETGFHFRLERELQSFYRAH